MLLTLPPQSLFVSTEGPEKKQENRRVEHSLNHEDLVLFTPDNFHIR